MGGRNLRTLGVKGKNAPTKQNMIVQASDFNIAGLIGQFERKYDKVFEVADIDKQREIFGENINSNWYGFDTAKTFWKNLGNAEGSLYIKAHVGYTGSAIDAAVAASTITDQQGLASVILLLAEALADYDPHDADAELGIGWSYHPAQETSNHSLTSITAPMTIDECIEKANELKTQYNGHDGDATAHAVVGSHQLTSADASNIATLVTLLTEARTKINAHAADAAQHTTAIDNVNFPLVSAAPTSTPVTTLRARAGYKALTSAGALEYGIRGNRTGFSIEHGVRFTTAMASATLITDTTMTVDSVAGISVGDIVTLRATGATPGVVHRKITLINEGTKVLTFADALAVTALDNDVVEVAGFKLKTYRKSISGIVTEVETALGEKWCTLESEVSAYYVENVHEENKYIEWDDQASASTGIETFPDEIGTVTYLTAGADGTAPTTSAHWSRDLTLMNNKPVRMLGNPETSDTTIQAAGETYCFGRDDTPIWFPVLAEDRTADQLKTLGAGYQRSGDVFMINVAEWLKIDDDFNTAVNAPSRNVPNIGAVMGAWIRTIATLGIHYIPCVDQINLIGINGVVNDNLGDDISDKERTDLAEYGINIIQFVPGSGYRIRNFFTASTSTAESGANGVLMRNFIKVSSQDSLKKSENTPNSFNRIKEDGKAVLSFMYGLWFKGSTGNVPVGETFGGPQQNDDGSLTVPEDHFQVTADAVNNPQANINLGERTIKGMFTYPAAAGSIEIQIGILLR